MIIVDFYRSLKAELLGLSVDKDELEHEADRTSHEAQQPHDDHRYHSDDPPPPRAYS